MVHFKCALFIGEPRGIVFEEAQLHLAGTMQIGVKINSLHHVTNSGMRIDL